MVNYQKTEQVWNSEPVKHSSIKYEKPPEQKGHKAWLQKVTNSHTKTFFQVSDLPIEWRRGKEEKSYPFKQTNQIIRIKAAVDCY
jgi:hypothetical protein